MKFPDSTNSLSSIKLQNAGMYILTVGGETDGVNYTGKNTLIFKIVPKATYRSENIFQNKQYGDEEINADRIYLYYSYVGTRCYANLTNEIGGLNVGLNVDFISGPITNYDGTADNNYKLAIKDTEFDSIFLELGENKEEAVNYIGAAGITIKPARKEKVDFATPYITTYQAIISSKENGYKTLDQLAGLNIGVQAGTTGQDIAEEYNKTAENDKKIKKIKDYSQVMQAFLDLKAGRIAAVIIDEAVAMQLVK